MPNILDAKDAVKYIQDKHTANPEEIKEILKTEDVDSLFAELAAHKRLIDVTHQSYKTLVLAMAKKMNITAEKAEPIVRTSVKTAYDAMTPVITRFNNVRRAIEPELTSDLLPQIKPETAKNFVYLVYGDRINFSPLFPKRDDIATLYRKQYGLEGLGFPPLLLAIIIIAAIITLVGTPLTVALAINEWRRLRKQDAQIALDAAKQFTDKELELHNQEQKVIMVHYEEELAALKKEYPNGGAEYTVKLKDLNEKHQTKSEEITDETRTRVEGYNKDAKDAIQKSGESAGTMMNKGIILVVVGVGGLIVLKGMSLFGK